jgi:hypothetical protein
LDRHVLFDVRPDDQATADERAAYAQVYDVGSDAASAALAIEGASRFDAPQTVRLSASRPASGNELTLHLVNYNRTEPAEKRSPGAGAAEEKPIAAPPIACDVLLPAGTQALEVLCATPESPEPVTVSIDPSDGRVRFTVPEFLVYAIARIRLTESRP